ncbi:hypothetical protein PoB_001351600 [Plakobranchus ocellatus]|uniref:Uncharacterized protein n=1 Tax=Plakobranchus ocellatus TaxID=259542 RepID=A0AAV3YX95_9GAST|nr:hypothetical protein PoB_001351600 [Plakobranchus ocellatus]
MRTPSQQQVSRVHVEQSMQVLGRVHLRMRYRITIYQCHAERENPNSPPYPITVRRQAQLSNTHPYFEPLPRENDIKISMTCESGISYGSNLMACGRLPVMPTSLWTWRQGRISNLLAQPCPASQ